FLDLSENSNLHLLQIRLFGNDLFDEIVSVSDVKVDLVLVFNVKIVFVSNIDDGKLVFISDVGYSKLVFASNVRDNSSLYRA
ncbi:8627_t:CDS:2, partial [Cetraspora pellucida]